MRKAILAALIGLAASIGSARAEMFDFGDWYNRARSFVESLTQPRPPGNEVAAVPEPHIDPKMSKMPQEPNGKTPIIPPPETRDGRKIDPR
jgi:hypothetical protein